MKSEDLYLSMVLGIAASAASSRVYGSKAPVAPKKRRSGKYKNRQKMIKLSKRKNRKS